MERGRVDDGEVLWARLAHDVLVVATPTRSFLADAGPVALHGAFLGPLDAPASPDVTRRLLDAAIGAAQRLGSRTQPAPPLTALRWAYRLAGYYHTTHATPRLMAEAAARFAAAGRHALAAWAERKVRDEHGHDTLALRDLAALGYDAEALVAAVIPPAPSALVTLFEALVRAADPVGCVGYAWALERLATTRDDRYLAAVRAVLPGGVDATRCLRVHSGHGSDSDHVDDIVALVARLGHDDREAIAAAAFRTTSTAMAPTDARLLDEPALENLLAPFRNVR
jgi:hypothetical protein